MIYFLNGQISGSPPSNVQLKSGAKTTILGNMTDQELSSNDLQTFVTFKLVITKQTPFYPRRIETKAIL